MVIGVFWSVEALSMPSVYGPALLINVWTSGEGEYQEKIQFLLPDRETIFAQAGPSTLALQSRDQVVPTVYRLELPLRQFGTNWVRVLLDDRVVLEYPLSVVPIILPRQEIKEGDLVQGTGPKVYLIERGRRRRVPDPDTFESMGFAWQRIKRLPDEQLKEIPEGRPLRRRT